ncbi:MAG: MerR family transcriptional regulator [Bacillota bacterium]|nr:MerR family transcriptional regulator [Bacillota bacterium]
MFKIGDFSKLTQVSVRMLRYYDELGLLKPSRVDRFTGYRFYSAAQIPRLNRIVALRDMGFLAAEIAMIMEENTNGAQLIGYLEGKKLEINSTIAFENNKLERIEKTIKSIETESVFMNYEISVKSVPSYKVASVRERIPVYAMEGILWEKLGKLASEYGIKCMPPCFAIYHDGEYKESNVDVEVVMCVDELQKSRNDITFREIEAVPLMASILVTGKYENITNGYNTLANWIEENGYEVTGLARQITHKGPWNESNPDNYLTEVQIPVTK